MSAEILTATTLRPLGHNVLVRPDRASRELESGLVMPDSVDEPPTSGIVVRVGTGPSESLRIRNAVVTRCLRELDAADVEAVSKAECVGLVRDRLLAYLRESEDLQSQCRAGDRVFFPTEGGYTVTLNEETDEAVTVLPESAILGVVEQETA